MLRSIEHRGPDSSKIVQVGDWKFGFNRLGIVGRNPVFDQPYTDDSVSYLIFNGEIYNYKELAAKYLPGLVARSDTQVLYKLLKLKSHRIIPELDGIFAFVFVDVSTNLVIAARDSFGVKPLYYYSDGRELLFSSELKPLRESKSLSYRDTSLVEYLVFGSVSRGYTIYKSLFQLEASSTLFFAPQTGLRIEKYSSLPSCSKGSPLESGIQSQIPDIDFGLMYSGGIDSTILLDICSQYPALQHTFSISVSHPEMDETYWQEMGLQVIQPRSKHHQLTDDSSDFSLNSLSFYNTDLDLPISHPSFIGSLKIANLAKSLGLKVLLCGEGADEVFHGYKWHLQKDLVNGEVSPFYLRQSDICLALSIEPCEFFDINEFDHDRFFFDFYLPRWLLRADLTGMKHSIENRVPFLSRDIVTFASTLSPSDKTDGFTYSKIYLKEYLSSRFPSAFVHRQKKGFDYPLNTWSNGELFDVIMSSDKISSSFKEMATNRFSDDYRIPRACFVLASFLIWDEIN
tara:strand:- start:3045 stop:4586 length:1542 start_codon:yes stop_codon:yes gene_type:complete